MDKNNYKKYLPYIVALVLFVIISSLYCLPVFQGKVIHTSDDVQALRPYRRPDSTIRIPELYVVDGFHVCRNAQLPDRRRQIPVGKTYETAFEDMPSLVNGYASGIPYVLLLFLHTVKSFLQS